MSLSTGERIRDFNNLPFGRAFASISPEVKTRLECHNVGKIKIKNSKKGVECLVCRGDVGFLRRLVQHRFCCREHERMYLAELEEVAVMRLRTLDAAGRARCGSRV